MSRRVRPYLFYDTTTSLCSTCLRAVEAKVVIEAERVLLDKWCPAHGMERVLVSDDVAYYRAAREVYVKPPELPERFNTTMTYGCPYDCGLCPDHMQHSCLTVVEITDRCNLTCPVCYAGSSTDPALTHRPLDEVKAMLDATVANEGEPDVVQLSGGEPTLHPQLFDILDECRRRPIRHLMLNTNGLRLATEPGFAERLAAYAPRFEVYLQFDSLRGEVHRALRGADLSRIRRDALARLNEVGLSTTLVMTVKKGVNDGEVGDVIRYALEQPCVRGVTLQPVSDAGRNDDWDPKRHRLTVSEVRRLIAEQSGLFTARDVLPVPCNPDTLAMAYALKVDGQVLPLTRYLDEQTLLAGQRNTIVFEDDPQLRDAVFRTFSTNHAPDAQARCLSDLLCCLPQVSAPPSLTYRNVFRVLIVQFMDARNMDLRALKKSCVHMARPDGHLIPFEAYNLFYRPGLEGRLGAIRAELERARETRLQLSRTE
jgi:uncharacterized radical SAM superfamily Fe-S cluster-containing enzyme